MLQPNQLWLGHPVTSAHDRHHIHIQFNKDKYVFAPIDGP